MKPSTGTDVEHSDSSSEMTPAGRTDAFENPGLPPHVYRLADTDPKAAKRAERQVVGLFTLSIIGTIVAIAAYLFIPMEHGNFGDIRVMTTVLGLGMAFSLLGIGMGAVHWAKTLMPDHEVIEYRHEQRGTDAERAEAAAILQTGYEETGIGRRPMIAAAGGTALGLFAIPGIIVLGDLGPTPTSGKIEDMFAHTAWDKGVRLMRDPTNTPIKASDVTIGSVFHVMPEGIKGTHKYLEEMSKAAVLLVRLEPEKVEQMPDRAGWDVDGIYAYSKICTHVGCPVALYEQQTHHLLCPCHQSTFDLTKHCEVIFGPAKRPLPQLPIMVDEEGYLVAQSDFHEAPGPSFWERG